MAKYYGRIGYAITEKVGPGIFSEKIIFHTAKGDVLKNAVKPRRGENINDDIFIENRISIVADQFAYENFHALKCVEMLGVLWSVVSVDVNRPRLILTLGGVFNAETDKT